VGKGRKYVVKRKEERKKRGEGVGKGREKIRRRRNGERRRVITG
jgi:hypothetical protein